MIALRDKRYVSYFDLILSCLGTKQDEIAIEFLEKAYEDREAWVPFMASDLRFNYLLDNPDFREIIKKTGINIERNK